MGKIARRIVKNLSFLVFLVATTVCISLSGCGAAPVPMPLKVEQKGSPITFIRDHNAGLEIAQNENKPTLVFFSAPDNIGSLRMMETAFCDEEVKSLAERFVCIHIDGSQELKLCESLKITGFPTILISNTNGTEVRRLVGKQLPDQLAVEMHVVLQSRALLPKSVLER